MYNKLLKMNTTLNYTFGLICCAATAKPLQLQLTLCDPMACSLPGSSVHGIFQQEYWSGLPLPSPMHACVLSRFCCVPDISKTN